MSNSKFLDIGRLMNAIRQNGTDYLFHANTLETSLSFFRHAHLLSRQKCRDLSLPMTPQYTDHTDAKFGIFDSLFFNMEDLHVRFERPNNYGPISFKISVNHFEKFLQGTASQVGMTTNLLPHRWSTKDIDSDRWISDVGQISTLSHPDIIVLTNEVGFPLDLVEEVIVDQVVDRPNFSNQVINLFKNCMTGHELEIDIAVRTCTVSGCKCGSHPEIVSRIKGYKLGAWNNKFGPLDDVA